jgi:hypothetical protein
MIKIGFGPTQGAKTILPHPGVEMAVKQNVKPPSLAIVQREFGLHSLRKWEKKE